MPYLSLYRKYRPRSFAEIAGQRHVTQTLANAVRANRVAHAYLFSGPRGTGKTSTARVLAMAINCDQGPTVDPCGECESCRRIAQGNALDVIEIDAASNRGIDEIRELRERVGLAPADARMKVYIIDEVHMLTPEAYNAFLKTLEEPPAHVVFVLATTEPHRVLPTILSRCQRFDFHRVGMRDLEERVRAIAAAESLDIDDRAKAMLAHAADGSMRDVLTLLDQAIAYAEGAITPQLVTEILGGIDFELLAEFTDIAARGDMAEALGFVDRVMGEGKDLRQLVSGLIGYHRNLLLLAIDRRSREAVSLPDESLARATEQAAAMAPERIIRALDMLAETERELRFTTQPRLLVELAALRMARVAEAAPAAASPKPRERKRAPAGSAAAPAPPAAETPPVAEAEEAPARPAGPVTLSDMRRRWDEVLAHLRTHRRQAESAFLRESVPVSLEEGVLTLEFAQLFHHDQMASEKKQQVLVEAIDRVFGVAVRVKCRMAASSGEPAGGGDAAGAPPRKPGRKGLDEVLSIFPGSEVEE